MIEKLLGTQASLSTGLPASVLWIGAQNALFRVPKNETSAGGEPPIALYLAPHSLRSVEDFPYFFLSRLLDNFW